MWAFVSMLWVVAPGRYPSSFQLGAGYYLPQQSTWVDTCNLVVGVIPFASSAPACSRIFPGFSPLVTQARCGIDFTAVWSLRWRSLHEACSFHALLGALNVLSSGIQPPPVREFLSCAAFYGVVFDLNTVDGLKFSPTSFGASG